MNLWGKTAGILFLAFVIIWGCREDEVSTLGFRKPDTKYKVSYLEVDVPSTLMIVDSTRTFNDPTNQVAQKRLLIGKYTDPKFGEVTAQAYTQFRPLDEDVDIKSDAKLVSAFLNLTIDYYYYGGSGNTFNSIFVHELTDSIRTGTPYFSKSSVAYDPTPIGDVSFEVDPTVFDINFEDNAGSDTSKYHLDTLSIKLNAAYATALFNAARSKSPDYTNFSKFKRIFKGFALVPGADTRIVGFNPENTLVDPNTEIQGPPSESKLVINYDETDDEGKLVRKQLEYFLFARTAVDPLIGFTQITPERGGTILGFLTEPYAEFAPPDATRYLQSGSPIVPKVDFSNFLNFADTIPNIILNSVEFSLKIDDPQGYPPPSTLRLRVLESNNRFKERITQTIDTPIDTAIILGPYLRSITHDEEGFYIIGIALNQSSVSRDFDITYNADDLTYRGDVTEFFQALTKVNDNQVLTDFALMALDPYFSRSVNRFTFKEQNLKLKIYYTVPAVDVKQ